MATPRLSNEMKNKILAEEGSNAYVAKKLHVSEGTVSNVRRGVIGEGLDIARAKREASRQKVRAEEALREIERLSKELTAFVTAATYAHNFRPVEITPKRGGRGEATAIICASDWHYEEKVNREAVNGVNEFDLQIAERRALQFWASAASLVDMCRTRSRIDSIVVNFLGDMINGMIHEEFVATNGLTPAEAVLVVFEHLVSGLEFLKKETKAKEIKVVCVCGNHGRFTKKRWSKKGPGMSFEWMLYNMLAKWFTARKDKVIQFVLPRGDMTYIKIYDRVIRVTHGDNIQYCGGLGGVHIPLRKAIDTWNTQIRADYNYFGHWHTDLTGEDYRISGSLIGYNEYSIRIKARFQRPSQAFELQHPRFGATARFPIILE